MANIEERLVRIGTKEDGSPLHRISYRVKIRLKDNEPVTGTFQRKTDAKRWILETESAIRNGRYFKSSESKHHTLTEAIDRYIVEVFPELAPKTQIVRKVHLAWWKKQLGHRTLADLTPAILTEFKSELSKGDEKPNKERKARKPATVLHYLASLSHVFSTAVRAWFWTEENPLEKVQKPKFKNARARCLNDEEKAALLSACQTSESPFLYTIVLLSLATGARKSEMLSIVWDDIAPDYSQVTFRATKNGETRTVPLVKSAANVLTAHAKVRRLDSKLVFPGLDPSKPLDIRSAWETARKNSKITDFKFHDLRHCSGSYLAMSGASSFEIMAVLGHKSAQMAKRYSHIGKQHTAGVMDRMAEKFL